MNTKMSFSERAEVLVPLNHFEPPFDRFDHGEPNYRAGRLVHLKEGDAMENNDIYEREGDIMVIGTSSTVRAGTKVDARILERHPRRWVATSL